VIGRFMAVDPVQYIDKGQGYFQRYTYADNNPYKYTDPSGESYITAAVIGATAIGIAVATAVNSLTKLGPSAFDERGINDPNISDSERSSLRDQKAEEINGLLGAVAGLAELGNGIPSADVAENLGSMSLDALSSVSESYAESETGWSGVLEKIKKHMMEQIGMDMSEETDRNDDKEHKQEGQDKNNRASEAKE
jgi:hypothetical protein